MVLGNGTVYHGIGPGLLEFAAKRMERTDEQQREGKEKMTEAETPVFIK